jgi:hypothetical protein
MPGQGQGLWLRITSVTLVVFGCGFVYHLLAKDWAKFARSVSEVDTLLFGASIGLGLLANLIAAYFYVFLLRGHHRRVRWRSPYRIFLHSQLVRYVPGKIWSYLYQIGSLPAGISKTTIVLTNLEMSLISMAIITGAGVVALSWPSIPSVFTIVICLSATISLCYRYGVVDRILRRLLFLLARLGVQDISRRPYDLAIMTALVAGWITLVFAALIVAMQAIWPLSVSDSIVYAACLSLSWIISALVFIVPVGIGVRETGFVALGALAISVLDGGQLAATAILLRFWQLIVDVLSGACGFLISGKSGDQAP